MSSENEDKAAEFVPAKEEQPEEQSPAQKAFLDETRALFEKMDGKEEPPQEAKVETPEPPPEKPKEDTGFIKDFENATPEDFKKRISFLYAQKKENERQWAEAREYMRKTREEMEELRKQAAREHITRTQADLDSLQMRVVELLDRNNPAYNPQEGARLLRELTNREVEAGKFKEQEEKREKEFKENLAKEEIDRNTVEAKAILDEWAATRAYAQPGHPLYGQVVTWLKNAYEKAPKEVTVDQIVKRAEQIFDAYEKKAEKPKEPPSQAAGANGEKLTVSAVLGTRPSPQKATGASDKLTAQQRAIAEKLFYSPERGVTKAKAHEMYAQGL